MRKLHRYFSLDTIVRHIPYFGGEKFIECISPFLYTGGVRKAILKLKFHNVRSNLDFFASSVAEKLLENSDISDVDYICFVPMSEKNFKDRGYNQSELLAQALGDKLKIPIKNVLVKIRETFTQHELGAEDRTRNLIGAFSVLNREEVRNKNFILCDDIVTTGNTFKECAKILSSSGAGKIICCTIASAK